MGRSSSRSKSRSPSGSRSRSHSRSRSVEKDRKRRSSSQSPSDDENLCRVHIADLGLDPSKTEISRAFEKFGPLREIWVARIPPCFAFVVYKFKDDANEAVRKMDGGSLNGKRIRVSIAKPRMKGGRPVGGGRNRRCYDCLEFGHLARDCTKGRRRYRLCLEEFGCVDLDFPV
uniref:CCHC-type domain-containing protein n=2 Tax=Arion vulgaris TaxID=1028688 RepID=A0A0B7ARK0_9EUPU